MRTKQNKKALPIAFETTLPVAAGYLVTGFAMGLLAYQSGYSAIIVMIMSVFLYAGTMQFVAIDLLLASSGPMAIITTTIIVQFRHFFYGLSLLDRYRESWKFKPYMISSLTDEAYVLHTLSKVPDYVDRGAFDLNVAVLCHCYWITGTVLGALLGQAFSIKIEGLDFALTALFVTSLVDNLKKRESRIPAAIGLVSSISTLFVFGADKFMLPALILITALLMIFKPRIEKTKIEKTKTENKGRVAK